MKPALSCRDVSKTYGKGELAEIALTGADIDLYSEDTSVLIGPSGSGKTTLMSILGCMLSPSTGSVEVDGEPIHFKDARKLAIIRRLRLGFIFQHSQLLPFMSAGENVSLVAENAGLSRSAARTRAVELLTRLGLEKALHKAPEQLSGGQRQRVAIARALVHSPKVILADEPTAALDWHNGQEVIELLLEQARIAKAAVLVVTHDQRLLPHFRRVLKMDQGILTEENRE